MERGDARKLRVDLNSDVGEGFGAYRLGDDEALFGLITSANIACGFHAGDPSFMRRTVRLAVEKGVQIGAHPGLPDLQGFGRREMAVSPQEAADLLTYQIGALQAFAVAEGGRLCHVKPHGALYNMAARDPELAEAIAEAVFRMDARLILYGLAGSELIRAGERKGLQVAQEVFADRTYQSDGSLTPRSDPRALISDAEEAARRTIQMIREGRVTSLNGEEVEIQADTICLHGDPPDAPLFARRLRAALEESGIRLQATGDDF